MGKRIEKIEIRISYWKGAGTINQNTPIVYAHDMQRVDSIDDKRLLDRSGFVMVTGWRRSKEWGNKHGFAVALTKKFYFDNAADAGLRKTAQDALHSAQEFAKSLDFDAKMETEG
ncbi:MAG: hypothetical protein OXD01_05055 [Gammaproteobacteria bacterium]|nr:hypothetical protein [Gammaproteobacteria bacterium]